MITLWNRKELSITFSMKEQSRICEILATNGIEYSVKIINRGSPSPFAVGTRATMGSFGEKSELSYEYKIYIQKVDYEIARSLIH